MCRTVLEDAGHDVEEAANGADGVRLFYKAPAAVVLCDIFMPLKDGLETITELKTDYPGVKIIAISGGGVRGSVSYTDVAERLGAVRTLLKPFGADELVDTVEQVLDEL